MLPLGLPVRGAVLTDQIRAIDRQARSFRHIGSVPKGVPDDALHHFRVLIGIRDD